MILCSIDTDVDWTEFHVGSSFFIPSYYPEKLIKDLKKELKYEVFEAIYAIRVEDDVLGVRVWRLK